MLTCNLSGIMSLDLDVAAITKATDAHVRTLLSIATEGDDELYVKHSGSL